MPRKKEDKTQRCYRINQETPQRLNRIAVALGYKNSKGAPLVGAMLDDLGSGKIGDRLLKYLHSVLMSDLDV